jgi:hypothetical protein
MTAITMLDKLVDFVLRMNPTAELMSLREGRNEMDPMRVVELLNQSQEIVNNTKDIDVALSRLAMCYDCVLWMASFAESTNNDKQIAWSKNAIQIAAVQHEELLETIVYRWLVASIEKINSYKTESARTRKYDELRTSYYHITNRYGVPEDKLAIQFPFLVASRNNQ